MKVFRHFIIIITWILLSIYLLTITAVHIPIVQDYLGSQTAKALACALDTKVCIGRINLGMFNRIVIDNVTVDDQRGKPLLIANRLAVRINLAELISQGKIVINTAQIFGAKIALYQPGGNVPANYQFALDRLSSKDKGGPSSINLHIGSLIMRNASVSYDCWDRPQTRGKFNPAHLSFSNISAYVTLRTLRADSVSLNIKRLSFEEQSGLILNQLSLELEACSSGLSLSNMTAILPNTTIAVSHIRASYRLKTGTTLLSNPNVQQGTLDFSGQLLPSVVTLSDFHFLMPKLRNCDVPLTVKATYSGTNSNIKLSALSIKSQQLNFSLNASGGLQRSPDAAKWLWSFNVQRFLAFADTWENVEPLLSPFGIQLPSTLQHIGRLNIAGRAHATASAAASGQLTASTDVGNIRLTFNIDRQHAFQAHLKAGHINMARLLDPGGQMGSVTASVALHGTAKSAHQLRITADAAISQMEYRGYPYTNIKIACNYVNKIVMASGHIADPNLELVFNGSAALSPPYKSLTAEAKVTKFRPQSLHLSNQWGDADFSGKMSACLKGNGIDNLEGKVTLSHFTMQSKQRGICRIAKAELTAGTNTEGHRMLTFCSDFGKMEMSGTFTYASLPQTLISHISAKLPTLPGLPALKTAPNNRFFMWAHLNDAEWMEKLLGIQLKLDSPADVTCKVDDQTKSIAFHATMPKFTYNGNLYSGGQFNLYCPGDTMYLDTQVKRGNAKGAYTLFYVSGNAANNHLTTSLNWQDLQGQRNRGTINTRTRFLKDSKGDERAEIDILHSAIHINGARWDVHPARLVYSKNNVQINSFAITHNNQHIFIDGQGTADNSDSIRVSLNDIDVAYILNLVNFRSVDFGGLASGTAYIKAPFGTFDAFARLRVSQFTFEQGNMGNLNANVKWDTANRQIDIDAVAVEDGGFQTIINGYIQPSPGHIDLGIRADGTNLEFLHTFTNSFTDYVKGRATGAVRLQGPLNEINLVGQLVVNGETFISPLGCTYRLHNDTVTLIPNEIELRQLAIYDAYGNKGVISGNIHHKHLTQLSYDLSVTSDNLQVYHFDGFGDNSFYGTFFGSGNVDIHGRSSELVIDINATPQPHSVFVYNVASPDAISDQEFIQWGRTDSTSSSAALPDVYVPQHTADSTARASMLKDDRLHQSTDIYINFLINATPSLSLKLLMDAKTNDNITLEGNGVLRATYYNKGSFNMYGTYTVSRGTYGITIQDIIKKSFQFNEGGTIVFGGNPYDASLNLQAMHTVNAVSLSDLNIGNSFSNTNSTKVNCLMNITGQPRAPRVDFDIDLPTVSSDEKQLIRSVINSEEEMNQQVVYLLGIGRFYPQGANNATMENGEQQSQTTLAMQSLLSRTLSSQINNLLNTMVNSNNWNFGANISTGDEGWNNAEYEGLLSGRLLNNRLLINGQFGYRNNAATANSSFIGDFDVRYLLTPNGNLSVKVYNQTNDRFFTRSSLNTQGAGLIMKRDFRGIADLFRFQRKKKKPEK